MNLASTSNTHRVLLFHSFQSVSGCELPLIFPEKCHHEVENSDDSIPDNPVDLNCSKDDIPHSHENCKCKHSSRNANKGNRNAQKDSIGEYIIVDVFFCLLPLIVVCSMVCAAHREPRVSAICQHSQDYASSDCCNSYTSYGEFDPCGCKLHDFSSWEYEEYPNQNNRKKPDPERFIIQLFHL